MQILFVKYNNLICKRWLLLYQQIFVLMKKATDEEEEMGGPPAYSSRRYVRGSAIASAMPRHGFHPSQRYRRKHLPATGREKKKKATDEEDEEDEEAECLALIISNHA